MEVFLNYQEQAEERFHKQEEERWKKECEMEEKRREADKVHELQVIQLMLQTLQNRGPLFQY